MKEKLLKCEYCGEELSPTYEDRRFCDEECSNAYNDQFRD